MVPNSRGPLIVQTDTRRIHREEPHPCVSPHSFERPDLPDHAHPEPAVDSGPRPARESSGTRDPDFVSIGNPDLIAKRAGRVVAIPPGGSLSDYVPFYFTPRSPMLYNIVTGHNGMKQTPRQDIAILVIRQFLQA